MTGGDVVDHIHVLARKSPDSSFHHHVLKQRSTEKKTTTICNPHPQSAPPTPPTIPRTSLRSPYTWLPESCRRITSQRLHHATSKAGDPTAQLIFPHSIPKPSLGWPAHENGLQSKLWFYLHRYALTAQLAAISPPKWTRYKLRAGLEASIRFLLEILWLPAATDDTNKLHTPPFEIRSVLLLCLLQGDAQRESEGRRPTDGYIHRPVVIFKVRRLLTLFIGLFNRPEDIRGTDALLTPPLPFPLAIGRHPTVCQCFLD